MSCSGLHCAGCAGGIALPVVPAAAFLGLAWVAEHLIEMVIVSATCGILSVAAVVALVRWQDRRQAAIGPLMVMRAEVLQASAPPQVTRPAAQVVEHHHYLHHAITSPDPASAIVRAAIPGQSWDAITDRR